MNEVLYSLENWCKENKMVINTTKTFYKLFTLAHTKPEINLRFNNETLNQQEDCSYLGIHLDQKLTWNSHANHVVGKVNKRCNILKRLAHTKWGCSRSVLNTTYKVYIKPVLLYGGENLITANRKIINKLETAQNQAMRIITGAVKTTPITAMQILTKNNPITQDIKKIALTQYEKLIRMPYENYWNKYRSTERNLKTQDGYIQTIKALRLKDLTKSKPEKLLLPISPLEYQVIPYRLNLIHNINKIESSPQEMKLAALETIHTLYPQTEWLHIYTDGSLLNKNGCAGAGVSCKLFNHYISAGVNSTHYDGELLAIDMALTQLLFRINMFQKVAIFSDSSAAIQAITQYNALSHRKTQDIQKKIKILTAQNKNIILQWVPAHCGLHGNEMADLLAKKGTTIQQIPHHELSYQSAKLIINKYIKNETQALYKLKSNNKPWATCMNDHSVPDSPRHEAVAMFRILTGHDCLAAHLHRLSIYQSPQCVLCNEEESIMTIDHLQECSALTSPDLDSTSKLYWEARRRMEFLQVPGH